MSSKTLNPEQEAAAASPGGYCMISANAGTGKTETSAEYVVRKYLSEEKRAFPGGRATGKDQIDLLRQFTVITFTNRAAQELDHRIRQKFRERGIPVPPTATKLCRTLDGLLQRWFFNPLFLKHLLEDFPTWAESSATWQSKASANPGYAEYEAQVSRSSQSAEAMWLQRWGLLLTPRRAAVLAAIALGNPTSVTEAFILSKLEAVARQCDLAHGRNYSSYAWEELEGHKAKEKKDLQHKILHQAKEQATRELQAQDLLQKEFIAAYDLARSYGYHPISAPHRLGHQSILQHLSCNKQLVSLVHLHKAATTYERLKLKFLAMDFGDFMWYVQCIFGKHDYLLEPGVEYPRLGFRAHWTCWDEAQDGGLYQYVILNYLSTTHGAGFGTLVTGDVKQSIYQWKGAQPQEFVKVAAYLTLRYPRNIFHLTCSYRSTQQVVNLGNEISQRLPSFGHHVQPSTTIYKAQGSVAVLAPVNTCEQEAEMVLNIYRGMRSQFGSDLSIFILWRKDGWRHPLNNQIPREDTNLRYLSIHDAKGLEADVVILLACNAGVLPNPGSEPDQEANLFYVAATRARSHVFISCSREYVDEEGLRHKTGPSPYLNQIPSLKREAMRAGWTVPELERGMLIHQQLDAGVKRGYDEAQSRMQEECKAMNIKHLTTKGVAATSYQHTGLAPRPIIQSVPQPPITPFTQEELDPNLQALLLKVAPSYPGRMPQLTTAEFRLGLTAGWWSKESSGWVFTKQFATISKKHRP